MVTWLTSFGISRVYSFVSLLNSGLKVPVLNLISLRLVSVLLQSFPISVPQLQVYIIRISSPASSLPLAAVKSLNPESVNQSLSVPIQPDCVPPANSFRPLISLIYPLSAPVCVAPTVFSASLTQDIMVDVLL